MHAGSCSSSVYCDTGPHCGLPKDSVHGVLSTLNLSVLPAMPFGLQLLNSHARCRRWCGVVHSQAVDAATFKAYASPRVTLLCICVGASYDVQQLAAVYSQVPNFLRHNITALTASQAEVPDLHGGAPTNLQGTAVYNKGGIIIFGDHDVGLLHALIHECAHSHDRGFSNGSSNSVVTNFPQVKRGP